MTLQLVRFRVPHERATEVEQSLDTLFRALEAASPAGIEYAAARFHHSPEFLLVLDHTGDGPNPLLELPAAVSFRARIPEWAGAPVPPEPLRLLGRYSG